MAFSILARRALIWAALLVLAAPGAARAQEPSSARREGLGVAVVLSVHTDIGTVLGLRVSNAVHDKAAFDVDIGWTIRTRKLPTLLPLESRLGKPDLANWHARGLVVGAQLRWLPKGRRESGWSTAITSSARIVQSQSIGPDNKPLLRDWTLVANFVGLGVDRVTEGGYRIGVEFGSPIAGAWRLSDWKWPDAGNRGPFMHAGVFGAWMQR